MLRPLLLAATLRGSLYLFQAKVTRCVFYRRWQISSPSFHVSLFDRLTLANAVWRYRLKDADLLEMRLTYS
jgi:hypothetical protein